jgi:hypothetical protein
MDINLNGLRTIRIGKTILIPLPAEAWREIDGGCSCRYCSSNSYATRQAYWDTLAVNIANGATWTAHAPEYQDGKKPLRTETV